MTSPPSAPLQITAGAGFYQGRLYEPEPSGGHAARYDCDQSSLVSASARSRTEHPPNQTRRDSAAPLPASGQRAAARVAGVWEISVVHVRIVWPNSKLADPHNINSTSQLRWKFGR